MLLKDLIEDVKKTKNLNNYQLADALDVSYTTVTRWINGSVESIHGETAKRFSELIGKDVQELLKANDQNYTRPVLGYTKAGYNLFLDENYLGDQQLSYEEYKNGDYFLKVVGDSMENIGITDGGVVYVKKCDSVENGQIVIARVGDEVTVKRYIKKYGGLVLRPENSYMEDKFFTNEEIISLPVQILGRVLFFKKNYD